MTSMFRQPWVLALLLWCAVLLSAVARSTRAIARASSSWSWNACTASATSWK